MDLISDEEKKLEASTLWLKMFERTTNELFCHNLIRHFRWPKGFICPIGDCLRSEFYPHVKGLKCKNCGSITSPTSGTFLHNTHLSNIQIVRMALLFGVWPDVDNTAASDILGIGSNSTLYKYKTIITSRPLQLQWAAVCNDQTAQYRFIIDNFIQSLIFLLSPKHQIAHRRFRLRKRNLTNAYKAKILDAVGKP